MIRIVVAISALCALALQTAAADEIRRATFAGALIGKWALTAELCATDDKSNFVIAAADFTGADGSCHVEAVVETPGSLGPNYAARGRCAATPQSAAHVKNLIFRPQSADRMSIGTSFEDFKTYLRCPAK